MTAPDQTAARAKARGRADLDVMLSSADSRETIERTHSNYFETKPLDKGPRGVAAPGIPENWLTPDQNEAMGRSRRCDVCLRAYTSEEVNADPAWEPSADGWRCGGCARARRQQLEVEAHRLIGQTEPWWRLITDPPAGADRELLRVLRELLLEDPHGLSGGKSGRCRLRCSREVRTGLLARLASAARSCETVVSVGGML